MKSNADLPETSFLMEEWDPGGLTDTIFLVVQLLSHV